MRHAAVKQITAQARPRSDLPPCPPAGSPSGGGASLRAGALMSAGGCRRGVSDARCRPPRRSHAVARSFRTGAVAGDSRSCRAARHVGLAPNRGRCRRRLSLGARAPSRAAIKNSPLFQLIDPNSPGPCETRHSGFGAPSLNLAALSRQTRHALRRASRAARGKRDPADRRASFPSGRGSGSRTEWRDRWPW